MRNPFIQISITRPDARAQAKIRTGLYFKIAKDQSLLKTGFMKLAVIRLSVISAAEENP